MTRQEYQDYLEKIVQVMEEDIARDLCQQDCCFKREVSSRLYDLAKATKVIAEFLLQQQQDEEPSTESSGSGDSAGAMPAMK